MKIGYSRTCWSGKIPVTNLKLAIDKKTLFLPISFVLFISWLIMILFLRPSYLNSVQSVPLALPSSLFPVFWLILTSYLLLCITMIYVRVDSVALHVLVLIQLALVLFYTPFAMSGFSWNPDSIWLSTVPNYISDILLGDKVMLSVYAQTYPSSFVLSNFVAEVTGIGVLDFARLYPIFSIIALTLLGYVLASRFVSKKAAFFSMLFILPGWHYVDFHACPHLTGILLLLTIILLLTHNEGRSLATAFFLILAMILSHPVSPLTLLVFLSSIYFCLIIMKKVLPLNLGKVDWIIARPRSMQVLMLTVIIGWASWLFYIVQPKNVFVGSAIRRVLTLDFASTFLKTTEFSLGSGSFIYPQIFELNRFVYISYIIVAAIFVFYDFILYRFIGKRRRSGFSFKRLVLLFSSFAFIAMSYLLLLGTGDHHLLYRGQIFFVIMISIYIVSHFPIQKPGQKTILIFLSSWLAFLLLAFPLISYSIGAYNSFPTSEGRGIEFIATHANLSGKSISMGADQQLSPYIDLKDSYDFVGFPPNMTKTLPEIIMLRQTSFYVIAMRYDISFENNRFVELQNQLNSDVHYNRIYANPTTEVYILNNQSSIDS
jgi:hypothetical protein